VERGDALRVIKVRLGRTEFAHKYGHLWLARELDPTEAPLGADDARGGSTIPMKLARTGRAGVVGLLERVSVEASRFGFYAIVKQQGGAAAGASPAAAPDRITVGRATSNDIVLVHESVSKLHAFFSDDEDRGWVLEDAGSTNGTLADGVVLAAGEAVAIKSGSSIVFGSLPCAVISSAELFDCL
jgi:FHA domain